MPTATQVEMKDSGAAGVSLRQLREQPTRPDDLILPVSASEQHLGGQGRRCRVSVRGQLAQMLRCRVWQDNLQSLAHRVR